MKVWITRWWFTEGIKECNAEKKELSQFIEGIDWHKNHKDAIDWTKHQCLSEITVYENKIANLNKIIVDIG